ncbi:hypothetical protein [Methanopyrus sp.]
MEVREASPDPRMRVSVRPKAGTWSETARFDLRWNFQRVTDELYVYRRICARFTVVAKSRL